MKKKNEERKMRGGGEVSKENDIFCLMTEHTHTQKQTHVRTAIHTMTQQSL